MNAVLANTFPSTLFFQKKVIAMNLSELEMESITGEAVSFSEYRDQALLIVNLASQ